ncbi:hypothetical protein N657DRAFT_674889 [Parathielavia appendiculata]|uniref:Uncharacterized protein n=1 Tax=Parathielavia appendiculata TaxID=2587402 RepID=A0AAN6Z0I1_9PEZI|nr:hypothetical protein N657DRAFT_674889 [Parathielavia appendiculata]
MHKKYNPFGERGPRWKDTDISMLTKRNLPGQRASSLTGSTTNEGADEQTERIEVAAPEIATTDTDLKRKAPDDFDDEHVALKRQMTESAAETVNGSVAATKNSRPCASLKRKGGHGIDDEIPSIKCAKNADNCGNTDTAMTVFDMTISTLLRLPAEIRLRIYAHLFKVNKPAYPQVDIASANKRARSGFPKGLVPSMTLVNKKISEREPHHEAHPRQRRRPALAALWKRAYGNLRRITAQDKWLCMDSAFIPGELLAFGAKRGLEQSYEGFYLQSKVLVTARRGIRVWNGPPVYRDDGTWRVMGNVWLEARNRKAWVDAEFSKREPQEKENGAQRMVSRTAAPQLDNGMCGRS